MRRTGRWFGAGMAAVLLLFGSLLLAWNRSDQKQKEPSALPDEVRQVLENATSMTLYRLKPSPSENGAKRPDLRGYPIVGKTSVVSRKTRRELVDALLSSIGKGIPKKCFLPHHGLRAVRGKTTVEMVLCFQCQQIRIYNNQAITPLSLSTSAQKTLDRILLEAGVPHAN